MHDVQPFQILAVLAAQAAISLPDPVPPWGVFAPGGEEHDCVVGLDVEVEVCKDAPLPRIIRGSGRRSKCTHDSKRS